MKRDAPPTMFGMHAAPHDGHGGPRTRSFVAWKFIAEKSALPEKEFLAAQAEIYQKYKGCAQDAAAIPPDDPFYAGVKACGARAPYVGSLYCEEMSCCGYDPQRRTFACPVKVKQVFGFGGTPLPGSREYVLHCVADAAGAWQPVGDDSVHLSNALAGQSPTRQFAVVAAANQNLGLVQPMNNQTRRARSILSWNLQPYRVRSSADLGQCAGVSDPVGPVNETSRPA
ncbi:MAG: hypothetical protein AB1430_24105 [Pseudomonadota bacterium]